MAPQPVSDAAKAVVKSTVPIVGPKVQEITKNFYSRMFVEHPQLWTYFNRSNQATGRQSASLAAAVVAYATHIDDPTPLIAVLKLIGHKHCALQVPAELYPAVGAGLLAAIKDVLGADVATPEVLAAWAEAYNFLAAVMIGIEEELYAEAEKKAGGWRGWKDLVVKSKTELADNFIAFELTTSDPPKDGFEFLPGQFLTVKVESGAAMEADRLTAPRHYTITSMPGEQHLTISVKKLVNEPAGEVSSYMHDKVKVGDKVSCACPFGVFYFSPSSPDVKECVCVSAGAGLTPMVAISKMAKKAGHKVVWIHADRTPATHAHKEGVVADVSAYFYTAPGAAATPAAQSLASTSVKVHEGRFTGKLGEVVAAAGINVATCDVYMCGVPAVTSAVKAELGALGVPADRLKSELFGPSS